MKDYRPVRHDDDDDDDDDDNSAALEMPAVGSSETSVKSTRLHVVIFKKTL